MDAAAVDRNIRNELDEEEIQLCGFKIGNEYYSIPVLDVQEVVKPQIVTPVPLSPDYVDGLINLRGQIVTAINLREKFRLKGEYGESFMNIIVRSEDSLYSLVVDEILDVMQVKNDTFEDAPETLNDELKQYIDGVFKLEDKLLILLSLNKLLNIN